MRPLKFIELSRWFNRNSQHYILGGWTVHQGNLFFPVAPGWPLVNRKLLNYYKGYPMAYLKFMWLSRDEWIGA